jgi:hypothetical protein
MKQILLLFFLMVCVELFAPEHHTLYILKSEAEDGLKHLIKAIIDVESRGNTFMFNPQEHAVGAFQIRQCKLTDYNRQTGSDYHLHEMFDLAKAEMVFRHFAKKYDSFEMIARCWNGSGEMTDNYWKQVKERL